MEALLGLKSYLQSVPKAKLVDDSRLVEADDIFVCHRGCHVEHVAFINQALEAGAYAVIMDAKTDKSEIDFNRLPLIYEVEDIKQAWDFLSGESLQWPDKKFQMNAVTGTDGKTSMAWLLYQWSLIAKNSSSSGINSTISPVMGHRKQPQNICFFGTIGWFANGSYESASINTTPSIHEIRQSLSTLNLEDSSRLNEAFIEVSSHAIVQKRLGSLKYQNLVLTGLGQDHLDYHGNLQAYHEAKLSICTEENAHCLWLQIDDEAVADRAAQLVHSNKVLVGHLESFKHNPILAQASASVIISKISKGSITVLLNGLSSDNISVEHELKVNGIETSASQRINLATSFALLLSMGKDPELLKSCLDTSVFPKGRWQVLHSSPTCIVDYAHTTAALTRALMDLKKITEGKVYLVFGCGGDRDHLKRPLMGEVAAKLADEFVVTSDNTRTETVQDIYADIVSGLPHGQQPLLIPSRKQAIENTLKQLSQQDTLLVAGMGHETWKEPSTSNRLTDAQVIEDFFLEQIKT